MPACVLERVNAIVFAHGAAARAQARGGGGGGGGNKSARLAPPLLEIRLDAGDTAQAVVSASPLPEETCHYADSGAVLYADLAFLAKACDVWANRAPVCYVSVLQHGFLAIATAASRTRVADFESRAAAIVWPERDRCAFAETVAGDNDDAGARVAVQLCGIGEANNPGTVPLVLLGSAFTTARAVPAGVRWDWLCVQVVQGGLVALDASVAALPCARVRVFAHAWGASAPALVVQAANECLANLKQALGMQTLAERARDKLIDAHVPALCDAVQQMLFSAHTSAGNRRLALEAVGIAHTGAPALEVRAAIRARLVSMFTAV